MGGSARPCHLAKLLLLCPSLAWAIVLTRPAPAFLALGSERSVASTQELLALQNQHNLSAGCAQAAPDDGKAQALCRQGENRAECTSPPLHAHCEWKEGACVAVPEAAGRQQAEELCGNLRQDICETIPMENLHGMPKDWQCKWQGNACVADSVCTKWENRNMFHENFIIMWMLGISGSMECFTKWNSGCSIGKGWHCLVALFLASCCCCCCCYPCWEALDDAEVRQKLSELPCCKARDSSEGVIEGDENEPFEQRPPDPRLPDDVIYSCDASDEWHELGSFDCEAALVGLLVKCSWKDQGWGERKGRVRTSLLRGSENLADEDTFGPVGRDPASEGYLSVERTFQPSSAIVRLSQPGDALRFEYTVGSGHGHVLHMRYFEALPNYGNGFRAVGDAAGPADPAPVADSHIPDGPDEARNA